MVWHVKTIIITITKTAGVFCILNKRLENWFRQFDDEFGIFYGGNKHVTWVILAERDGEILDFICSLIT